MKLSVRVLTISVMMCVFSVAVLCAAAGREGDVPEGLSPDAWGKIKAQMPNSEAGGAPEAVAGSKQLLASDGASEDHFGITVALFGDIAAVAAPAADIAPNANQGAVYIFYRNQGGAGNWGQVKKITASDGSANDYFGRALSLHEDKLVVGSHDMNGVYVYYRNSGGLDNWGEVKKLTVPSLSHLGGAVSVYNDIIVAGDQMLYSGRGTVCVFYRNQGGQDNWGLEKQILASDGAAEDYFGTSVSVDGYSLAVGSRMADIGGNEDQGAVYVFYRNQGGADNWGEVKKITAGDGAAADQFGEKLALQAGTLVAASHYAHIAGEVYRGAAWVFCRDQGGENNWGEVKKLTASDGAENDGLGDSVAISGDRIMLGAASHGNSYITRGAVYVYSRNQGGADNWGQAEEYVCPSPYTGDQFGDSVAICGNTLLAGDFNMGGIGGVGAAYILDLTCAWKVRKVINDAWVGAISIWGDTVAVGNYLEDIEGWPDQGAVYLFKRNQGGADQWGLVKKIVDGFPASYGEFGRSVCLVDDKLFAGCTKSSYDSANAYVYYRNKGGLDNWGFLRGFVMPDYSTLYGRAMASDGDIWMIGEPLGNGGHGMVYVNYRNQDGADLWEEAAYLYPSITNGTESFGEQIALFNDVAAVSLPGANLGNGNNRGAVEIFYKNQGGSDNWGLLKQLSDPSGSANYKYGLSLGLWGDTLAVTDYSEMGTPPVPSSLFIYSRNSGGADQWGLVKKIAGTGCAGIWGDTIAVRSGSDPTKTILLKRNLGGADNWGQAGMALT